MVKKKKSQGLPLNTIILFIIVVVVLVITIVWFVNKFNSNSQKIDKTSGGVTDCSNDNPVLSKTYTDITKCPATSSKKAPTECAFDDNGKFKSCSDGYSRIMGVTLPDGYAACCGKEK